MASHALVLATLDLSLGPQGDPGTAADAVAAPDFQMASMEQFDDADDRESGGADAAAALEQMVGSVAAALGEAATAATTTHHHRPTLNSLPTEIMVEILLRQCDLRSLAALLFASRPVYCAFVCVRKQVLAAVLARELPRSALTGCRYAESASQPDETIDSQCLNQRHIHRFADCFIAQTLYHRRDPVPATHAEAMCVQRCVYHYFVLASIYAKTSRPHAVANCLSELAPWEVEEIMIMVAFIHQLTRTTCESALPLFAELDDSGSDYPQVVPHWISPPAPGPKSPDMMVLHRMLKLTWVNYVSRLPVGQLYDVVFNDDVDRSKLFSHVGPACYSPFNWGDVFREYYDRLRTNSVRQGLNWPARRIFRHRIPRFDERSHTRLGHFSLGPCSVNFSLYTSEGDEEISTTFWDDARLARWGCSLRCG